MTLTIVRLVSWAPVTVRGRRHVPPCQLDKSAVFVRVNSEYFEVDAGSGVLYVARQIDRDVVCHDVLTSVCRLTLDVALLRPVSLFRVFHVHVDVLDLNDNDPSFRVEDFLLTIPESVSPGK